MQRTLYDGLMVRLKCKAGTEPAGVVFKGCAEIHLITRYVEAPGVVVITNERTCPVEAVIRQGGSIRP